MAELYPTNAQSEAVLIVEAAGGFIARVELFSDEALRLTLTQLMVADKDDTNTGDLLDAMRSHIVMELRRRAEETSNGGQVVH